MGKYKRPKRCKFRGCDEQVYARGYCRRHYNLMWRRGNVGHAYAAAKVKGSELTSAEAEQLGTLQREKARAEAMYANVYGVMNRVRWRREIEALDARIKEIKQLGDDRAKTKDNKKSNSD